MKNLKTQFQKYLRRRLIIDMATHDFLRGHSTKELLRLKQTADNQYWEGDMRRCLDKELSRRKRRHNPKSPLCRAEI